MGADTISPEWRPCRARVREGLPRTLLVSLGILAGRSPRRGPIAYPREQPPRQLVEVPYLCQASPRPHSQHCTVSSRDASY